MKYLSEGVLHVRPDWSINGLPNMVQFFHRPGPFESGKFISLDIDGYIWVTSYCGREHITSEKFENPCNIIRIYLDGLVISAIDMDNQLHNIGIHGQIITPQLPKALKTCHDMIIGPDYRAYIGNDQDYTPIINTFEAQDVAKFGGNCIVLDSECNLWTTGAFWYSMRPMKHPRAYETNERGVSWPMHNDTLPKMQHLGHYATYDTENNIWKWDGITLVKITNLPGVAYVASEDKEVVAITGDGQAYECKISGPELLPYRIDALPGQLLRTKKAKSARRR